MNALVRDLAAARREPRVEVRCPWPRMVIPLLGAVVGAHGLNAQQITGRVIDAETQAPITSAEVRVRADSAGGPVLARAVADSFGAFEIELEEVGSVYLEASSLGYNTSGTRVQVRPAEALEVLIRLSTDPVIVDPIQVRVRRRPTLSADPFEGVESRELLYGRRGTGTGHFFDREQLQEIAPGFLTEVLVRTPGYRMTGAGIRLQSRDRCDAGPTYYVNGRRFVSWRKGNSLTEIQQQYRMRDLAVEVYRVSWQAPIEYQNMTGGCGVVAFWFRYMGEEDDGVATVTAGRAPGLRAMAGWSAPLGAISPKGIARTTLRPYPVAGLEYHYGARPYIALHWSPRMALHAPGDADAPGYSHTGHFVLGAVGAEIPGPLDGLGLRAAIGLRTFLADRFPFSCAGSAQCLAIERLGRGRTDPVVSAIRPFRPQQAPFFTRSRQGAPQREPPSLLQSSEPSDVSEPSATRC